MLKDPILFKVFNIYFFLTGSIISGVTTSSFGSPDLTMIDILETTLLMTVSS